MNMNMFSKKFNKYILEKIAIINLYISKKKRAKKIDYSNKSNTYYLNEILQTMNNKQIISIILYYFFKIVTQKKDEYENVNKLNTAIDFGKCISNEYIYILYKNYINTNEDISLSKWKELNQEIVKPFEDNNILYSYLGSRILIELLTQVEMIYSDIVKKKSVTDNTQFKILNINDEVSQLVGNNIYISPVKLPMIVPPKDNTRTDLGGGSTL